MWFRPSTPRPSRSAARSHCLTRSPRAGRACRGKPGGAARPTTRCKPVVPWHTDRTRIAEIGHALALVAGVAEKIGFDVALLAQTEVGEVAEAAGGGSSTMPQKRNPVGSTLAQACARLVRGHTSVLDATLAQEHERAIGAWHARGKEVTHDGEL